MTDEKPSAAADDWLGIEIAATMRDHEQSASVDGIIAAVTSGSGRSRRWGSVTAHRQRSAVWLAAAAVVLLAGVTGLVMAGNSGRTTAPPVTSTSPPAVTALAALVVEPGGRVNAEGLGGVVTAGKDSFELCSLYTGAATSQSPGPSDSADRPGVGCTAMGAIKIATLESGGSVDLGAEQERPVQVSGTYNADGSITVDDVVTAPSRPRPEDGSMTTPCPTPSGGWRSRDGDPEALNTFLNEHIDQYLVRGTQPKDENSGVVTVGTVSRNLTETRTQLEKLYGAPVCVYRATHSKKQLEAATSAAESILRADHEDLYTGPYNSVDSSLPLSPDSDTSVGYTRIITPTLAQELAPFDDVITFEPFIRPVHEEEKTTTSSPSTTIPPTVADSDSNAAASTRTSPDGDRQRVEAACGVVIPPALDLGLGVSVINQPASSNRGSISIKNESRDTIAISKYAAVGLLDSANKDRVQYYQTAQIGFADRYVQVKPGMSVVLDLLDTPAILCDGSDAQTAASDPRVALVRIKVADGTELLYRGPPLG